MRNAADCQGNNTHVNGLQLIPGKGLQPNGMHLQGVYVKEPHVHASLSISWACVLPCLPLLRIRMLDNMRAYISAHEEA